MVNRKGVRFISSPSPVDYPACALRRGGSRLRSATGSERCRRRVAGAYAHVARRFPLTTVPRQTASGTFPCAPLRWHPGPSSRNACDACFIGTAGVAVVARPPILAGVDHHPRPHRVEFDIEVAGQQVAVAIDQCGLEASFP